VINVLRQMSNFSAISWREQVTFWWDDDEFCSVLCHHAELDFYNATSLTNSPRVDMSVHSDT